MQAQLQRGLDHVRSVKILASMVCPPHFLDKMTIYMAVTGRHWPPGIARVIVVR